MKKTITQKRAELYKLYVIARCGNDERMYTETLSLGIPDGETIVSAYTDICFGDYDENIDETIELYKRVISIYQKYGFTIDGKNVIYSVGDLIERIQSETDIVFPDKIYKVKY